MLPKKVLKNLATVGVPPRLVASFADSEAAVSGLSAALESAKFSTPGDAYAAFTALIVILQSLGRYEAITEALRAPWSPVRNECTSAFDQIYMAALAATRTLVAPLKRRQRFSQLALCLSKTRGIKGDVVECGCARGLSSHVICQVLRHERRDYDGSGYHIFDSFEGLPEPSPEDAIGDEIPNAQSLRLNCVRGHFKVPLAVVISNLKEFPRITYHPGWIPETFGGLPETTYRFVHLDVDLYDATAEGLEYFYGRLAPGGMIVSDDYSWPGARLAIQEFGERRGVRIEITPFDQAVIRSD